MTTTQFNVVRIKQELGSGRTETWLAKRYDDKAVAVAHARKLGSKLPNGRGVTYKNIANGCRVATQRGVQITYVVKQCTKAASPAPKSKPVAVVRFAAPILDPGNHTVAEVNRAITDAPDPKGAMNRAMHAEALYARQNGCSPRKFRILGKSTPKRPAVKPRPRGGVPRRHVEAMGRLGEYVKAYGGRTSILFDMGGDRIQVTFDDYPEYAILFGDTTEVWGYCLSDDKYSNDDLSGGWFAGEVQNGDPGYASGVVKARGAKHPIIRAFDMVWANSQF